jgi:predicted metal-dependent hydrolase
MQTFRVGSTELPVRVRRSPRARRYRIVLLSANEIEVVVPQRGRLGDVERILEEKRRWLERAVAQERARPQLGLDGGVWLHGEQVAAPRGALEPWYRRRARAAVSETAEREAARLGLGYDRIRIADQRTRWGSCSTRGTLSFSWRLVLAPRRVLDYVVVHELCHLRHPNHSPRFWAELDAARPEWRAEARWLRDHGRELGGYAPPEPV